MEALLELVQLLIDECHADEDYEVIILLGSLRGKILRAYEREKAQAMKVAELEKMVNLIIDTIWFGSDTGSDLERQFSQIKSKMDEAKVLASLSKQDE